MRAKHIAAASVTALFASCMSERVHAETFTSTKEDILILGHGVMNNYVDVVLPANVELWVFGNDGSSVQKDISHALMGGYPIHLLVEFSKSSPSDAHIIQPRSFHGTDQAVSIPDLYLAPEKTIDDYNSVLRHRNGNSPDSTVAFLESSIGTDSIVRLKDYLESEGFRKSVKNKENVRVLWSACLCQVGVPATNEVVHNGNAVHILNEREMAKRTTKKMIKFMDKETEAMEFTEGWTELSSEGLRMSSALLVNPHDTATALTFAKTLIELIGKTELQLVLEDVVKHPAKPLPPPRSESKCVVQ